MMKRLTAIIMIGIMAFSLCSCDKDKDKNKKEPTASLADALENTDKPSDKKEEPVEEASGKKEEDKADKVDIYKAFEAFLKDDEAAVSDIDKKGLLRSGNRYSFTELVRSFLGEKNQYDAGIELYDASYTYIDCGEDGVEELAVWFNFGMNGIGDYDNALCVFYCDDEGEVHIIGYDYWGYRSQLTLNEYGYVTNGGSGGAAVFCEDRYFFNADHERIFLYSMEEEMELKEPMVNKYYLKNGFDRTDYPEKEYDENGKGYTVYMYSFKEHDYDNDSEDTDYYEKYYKDYMYAFTDYRDEPAAPDEKLADFYKKENVKWYSPDKLDKMILDHQHELGADDDIINGDNVSWDSLSEEGMIEYKVSKDSEDGPDEQEEKAPEVKYYTILDDHEKPYISPKAQTSREYRPISLKEVSCTENNITDVDEWFRKAGSSRCGEDFFDSNYRYVLTGDAGYRTMTRIEVYSRETGDMLYSFDFSDFLYEDGYENEDFVDRGVHHCFITDDYLYLNLYHPTYAESCPANAYMICVDINTGEVIWISDALISNSGDFARWGDNMITGYGFTAEDDYIHILNRFTGEVTQKIKVKKSPDYFCFVDNDLWVRTYSYDYVYKIQDSM
ncbi:MAG: hypothetical protein K5857_08300 [Lachnospiraceae bacterium]|nr:hypothetical protein [Lachnospiraceae bacterium]